MDRSRRVVLRSTTAALLSTLVGCTALNIMPAPDASVPAQVDAILGGCGSIVEAQTRLQTAGFTVTPGKCRIEEKRLEELHCFDSRVDFKNLGPPNAGEHEVLQCSSKTFELGERSTAAVHFVVVKIGKKLKAVGYFRQSCQA